MYKIIKQEYDSRGNETYCEWSNGYWAKWEYDENGNITYCEDSDGYWAKSEYDENGNEICFENSNGTVIEALRAGLEQESDTDDKDNNA